MFCLVVYSHQHFSHHFYPGNIRRVTGGTGETLKSALENYTGPIADGSELADILALIRRCLVLDPTKRPSARELTEDPLFKMPNPDAV
jgi:serine/threonine protein kinase